MSIARFKDAVDVLAEDYGSMRPLRGGSLIITVFGDAILPRGGSIWLGSLIKLVQPLGLSERLVRTSVFRLSQDGWIESTQVGRRSYYAVAPTGERSFATATNRIYGYREAKWNQTWRLLILPQTFREGRDQLRKELLWQGFGALSTGVMGHPDPDETALAQLIEEMQLTDKIVMMDAQVPQQTQALTSVIRDCWNLEELESAYTQFIRQFTPLKKSISRVASLPPREAFLARTLLIHQFRKTLLRDPTLPAELLPEDWIGVTARDLCRHLYRRLYVPSEAHLSAIGETLDGPLEPADPSVLSRFGGLEEAA